MFTIYLGQGWIRGRRSSTTCPHGNFWPRSSTKRSYSGLANLNSSACLWRSLSFSTTRTSRAFKCTDSRFPWTAYTTTISKTWTRYGCFILGDRYTMKRPKSTWWTSKARWRCPVLKTLFWRIGRTKMRRCCCSGSKIMTSMFSMSTVQCRPWLGLGWPWRCLIPGWARIEVVGWCEAREVQRVMF